MRIKNRNAAELLSTSEIRSNIRNENLERNQREQFFSRLTSACKQSLRQNMTQVGKVSAQIYKNVWIYGSRNQFKSKPFDLPLSAVTLHLYIHMLTFSIACYICPRISHISPNQWHLFMCITPYCCYIREKRYMCDPRTQKVLWNRKTDI